MGELSRNWVGIGQELSSRIEPESDRIRTRFESESNLCKGLQSFAILCKDLQIPGFIRDLSGILSGIYLGFIRMKAKRKHSAGSLPAE